MRKKIQKLKEHVQALIDIDFNKRSCLDTPSQTKLDKENVTDKQMTLKHK